MSETPEEYVARRLALSARRQEAPSLPTSPVDDAHGKSGCCDCDFLAFGPTAEQAARDHRRGTKHQTWVISRPEGWVSAFG